MALKWTKAIKDNKPTLRHLNPKYFHKILRHESTKFFGSEEHEIIDNLEDAGPAEFEFMNSKDEIKIQPSEKINKLQLQGKESITAVAISERGNRLAFASLRETKGFPLEFVEITEGEAESKSQATVGKVFHDDMINGICFEQYGAEVAACDNKGNIKIYDASTGSLLAEHNADTMLLSISYIRRANEKRYLACGCANNEVLVFEVNGNTGEEKKDAEGEVKTEDINAKIDEEIPTNAPWKRPLKLKLDKLLQDQKIQREGVIKGVALIGDFRYTDSDGLLVAVGSADKTISIYVVVKGTKARRPSFARPGGEKKPSELVGEVVSDQDPGKTIFDLKLPVRVESLSASADGTKIAFGGERSAAVLEYKEWHIFHDGHDVEGFKSLKHMLTPAWMKKNEKTEKWDALYDWEEGCVLETKGEISSICLSGDGKRLMIGSNDKTARIYDVETAAEIHCYERSARVNSVAMNKDGTYALVGGFDAIAVRYNLESGLSPSCIINQQRAIQSVDISGDGLKVMTCSLGKVDVYDMRGKGRCLASIPRKMKKKDKDMVEELEQDVVVYCGELTYYGDYCLAGGYDNMVIMYKVDIEEKSEADTQLKPEGGEEQKKPEAEAFEAGTQLKVGEEEQREQHKPGAEEVLRLEQGWFVWGLSIRHMNEKNGVTKLESGKPFLQVAVGSWDGMASVYEISWHDSRRNPFTYVQTAAFKHADRVFSTSLSGDGKYLAVGTRDCRAVVYDIELHQELQNKAKLSKAVSTKKVQEEKDREAVDNCIVKEWKRPERVYSVSLSHDSKMLAVSDVEKNLIVYDMNTRKERNSWQCRGVIHDVEFSPTDEILAAGGEDNKITFYDLNNDKILLQVPLQGVCWDLGICFKANSFICAEGNRAVVYGEAEHGYGMHDRPSFTMARMFLKDLESLKITIGSHPTLLNAIGGKEQKTLLHLAVIGNFISAAKLLLDGDTKLALLVDKEGQNALTEAALGRKKQMLQLLFDGIIKKQIVDAPATLEPLYSYVWKLKKLDPDYNKLPDEHKITLFEDIGLHFPDILLTFLEEYEVQKCEPFVLGSLTQAPIRQSTMIGLPRRAPRDFWRKYFFHVEGVGRNETQSQRQGPPNRNNIELAVEAYRLPLRGIMQKFKTDEKIRHNKEMIFRNASPLEVIVLAATRMKDYSVFKDDTIASTMIKAKWQTVKSHFLIQFMCYFAYMILAWLHANAIANLSSACLDGYNLKLSEIWDNDFDKTWGKIGLLTFPPVAIMSVAYLIHEFRQFKSEGFEPAAGICRNMYYMISGYTKSYWNFIDVMLHTVQLAASILFLLRSSGARPVASIAIIFVFVKLLFYCRYWDEFGPLVRMIFRTIKSMGPFLSVIVVLLLGFGMVFKVLEVDTFDFRTYPRSFIQASLMIYGEFDALEDHLGDPGYNWLTVAMFELLMLLVVIVLLNLLIAIMSDTYSDVHNNATLEYRLEQANIILEVEKSSAFSRTDARLFPEWLHILRPTISLESDSKTEFQTAVEKLLNQNSAISKRQESIDEYLRDISMEIHKMKVQLGTTYK